MRAVFADGTTAARVVALIEAFPLQGLSGAPTAETVEDGVRILFRRSRIEASGTLAAAAAVVDDGTLLPDGGLFFRVVPTDDGTAVALVASRIAAGIEDMPKVIREKQVCKKMLAKIKESVDCKSAGFRPVGSGSFESPYAKASRWRPGARLRQSKVPALDPQRPLPDESWAMQGLRPCSQVTVALPC